MLTSDHDDPVSECPCMIPQTSLCVAPGEALTLDCDPGGECLNGGCSWDTPAGEGGDI